MPTVVLWQGPFRRVVFGEDGTDQASHLLAHFLFLEDLWRASAPLATFWDAWETWYRQLRRLEFVGTPPHVASPWEEWEGWEGDARLLQQAQDDWAVLQEFYEGRELYVHGWIDSWAKRACWSPEHVAVLKQRYGFKPRSAKG